MFNNKLNKYLNKINKLRGGTSAAGTRRNIFIKTLDPRLNFTLENYDTSQVIRVLKQEIANRTKYPIDLIKLIRSEYSLIALKDNDEYHEPLETQLQQHFGKENNITLKVYVMTSRPPLPPSPLQLSALRNEQYLPVPHGTPLVKFPLVESTTIPFSVSLARGLETVNNRSGSGSGGGETSRDRFAAVEEAGNGHYEYDVENDSGGGSSNFRGGANELEQIAQINAASAAVRGNTNPNISSPTAIGSGSGSGSGGGDPVNELTLNIKFVDDRRHPNFTLTVNNATTIFGIKDLILRKTNYNTYKQTLLHKGRILVDENNLSNYGIINNDTIYVKLGVDISVTMKRFSGETFSIRVNTYDTIQDMKIKIIEFLKKDIPRMRLVYQGRPLTQDLTHKVEDWNIQDGDLIYLIE